MMPVPPPSTLSFCGVLDICHLCHLKLQENFSLDTFSIYHLGNHDFLDCAMAQMILPLKLLTKGLWFQGGPWMAIQIYDRKERTTTKKSVWL